MLNSRAVLHAGGWFVVIDIQTAAGVEVGRFDGLERGYRTGREQDIRILHLHSACPNVQTEGQVGTGIVHIVALGAVIHDGKSAANDRLTTTGQVVGKAEPRSERRPVVVHKTSGYTVLSRHADSIQVKRNARKDGVRAGAEPRACGCATRIGWTAANISLCIKGSGQSRIIELWIEVPHVVVGFVGVRHAVPPQAEIQGKSVIGAPIVLNIGSPGNVRPSAFVLDG